MYAIRSYYVKVWFTEIAIFLQTSDKSPDVVVVEIKVAHLVPEEENRGLTLTI